MGPAGSTPGAPRQSFELIKLHRLSLDVVDLALQKWMEKRAARSLVILDLQSQEVHYQKSPIGGRLGSLEKRVLLMLANESLSGAEIARRLGVWHQAVYKTLRRLCRKDLVKSWTALGENLAGSKVLRRFYALNPEKVSIAVPVGTPTDRELQAAKEKAQREAIRREREGIRLQRELSPKPSTRLKAALDQSHSPMRSRRDP